MNRDRFIALVLALLLLLSLVANWMLWRNSRGGDRAVVAGPVARAGSGPRESGERSAYEFVDNPAMKGRLGRIVIAYVNDVKLPPDSNRTAFYKAGTSELIHSAYGAIAAELPPSSYDLEVNGKKLAGVPVKSGKDTRVPSGVLKLHGSDQTRFVIFDVGGKEHIRVAYGNAVLGLPAGDYEIEVSGQRDKFTIEPGKVTDF